MKTFKLYATLSIIMMSSCEKFSATEDETTPVVDPKENVTFKLTESEQVQKTCKKVSYAIFNAEGKVKNIHQEATDSDFGTLHLQLPTGSYRLSTIGHCGTNNCTISSPEKVTFTNNKLTDTFYDYQTFEVEGDKKAEAKITLQRAVALFRLHIKDDIPEEAKHIKFYYIGGSSTLDTTTGFGNVNSRQSEIQDMSPSQKDYEVYTFPHQDGKKLKMTITVMDDHGSVLASMTLTDVSIKKNYITTYSGNLFKDKEFNNDGNTEIDFVFDARWAGEYKYTF